MNVVAQKVAPSYQDLSYSLRPKLDPDALWVNVEHIGVRSLIDREVFDVHWFDACFKAAFVRNPWDRLVSLFHHLRGYRLTQKRERVSNKFLVDFPTFVDAVAEGSFVRPLGKLCVDDWSQANPQIAWLDCGVDFIGRHERLDEDWKKLCGIIEMEWKELPHEKRSEQCGVSSYRYHYNSKLIDIVGRVYSEEIERFGYEF